MDLKKERNQVQRGGCYKVTFVLCPAGSRLPILKRFGWGRCANCVLPYVQFGEPKVDTCTMQTREEVKRLKAKFVGPGRGAWGGDAPYAIHIL